MPRSVSLCSKTDYAANGGSVLNLGGGPPYDTTHYTSTCFATYPNCAWTGSTDRYSTAYWVSGARLGEIP